MQYSTKPKSVIRRTRRKVERQWSVLNEFVDAIRRKVMRPVGTAFAAVLQPVFRTGQRLLRKFAIWNWIERQLVIRGWTLEAIADYWDAWRMSRHWSYLLHGLPAVLLATSIAGMAFYRWQAPPQDVIRRYKTAFYSALDRSDLQSANMSLEKLHALGDQDSDVRYQYALKLAAEGDMQSARELMESLAPGIGNIKGHPPAHFWLAHHMASQTANWRGELTNDQREQLLTQLWHLDCFLQSNRGHSVALTLSGNAYRRLSQLEMAQQQFEKAATRDPAVRMNLAETCEELGLRETASEAWEAAHRHFQARIEKNPADVQSRFWLAYVTWRSAGYRTAAAVLRQGLDLTNDRRLRNLMAAIHLNELNLLLQQQARTESPVPRRIQEELNLLQQALTYSPDNMEGLQQLTRYLMGDEQHPELSTLDLRDVLVSGKATATSHLLLAIKQLETGDNDAANFHLQVALRQNPSILSIINNLAVSMANNTSPRLDMALLLANSALQLISDERSNPAAKAKLYETRGLIHVELEQWEDARDDLERAILNLPATPFLHEKLSAVHTELGDTETALRHQLTADELREAEEQDEQILIEQADHTSNDS